MAKIATINGTNLNGVQVQRSCSHLLFDCATGDASGITLSVSVHYRNENRTTDLIKRLPLLQLAKIASMREGYFVESKQGGGFTIHVLLGASGALDLSADRYLVVTLAGVGQAQNVDVYAFEGANPKSEAMRYTENTVAVGDKLREFFVGSSFSAFVDRTQLEKIRLFYDDSVSSVCAYLPEELAMLERSQNDMSSIKPAPVVVGDEVTALFPIATYGSGKLVAIPLKGVLRYELEVAAGASFSFYTMDIVAL